MKRRTWRLQRTTLFGLILAVSIAGTGWCELQGQRITTIPDGEVRAIVPLNGGLWLAVTTGENSPEVWFVYLKTVGTTLIKVIPQMYGAWRDEAPKTVTVGGTVFFTVQQHPGQETDSYLWKSDGTQVGTVEVGGGPGNLMGELNGAALYTTYEEQQYKMWRSDGTESGTYLIKIGAWPHWSSLTAGGIMYFCAESYGYGRELWRTDGSETGTFMPKDLAPGMAFGCLMPRFALGNVVYFLGGDAASGGLARSDGTADGTYVLKDGISPQSVGCAVGTTAFFGAEEPTHGFELWRTDGTEEGTVLVKDIKVGPEDGFNAKIIPLAGEIFFIGDDVEHGRELWKSDGTEAGTVRVTDFAENARAIYECDGHLYLTVSNSQGLALYQSDGTVEGTVLTGILTAPPGYGYLNGFWSLNGTVYFGWLTDAYPSRMGRIIDGRIEWPELRDVAQGLSDTVSADAVPCTIGNTTYFCGSHRGLWAVNNAFRFVRNPYGGWKTAGDNLNLSVECAGGIGSLSYQWYKDGEPIDGETDATFAIASLTSDDTGAYTCRVTDAEKTIYESTPAVVEVFGTGTLPAAGILAMAVLATACAIGAAHTIMRRKR